MSTENEGAGTTPPASDAASADDFPLPKPEPGAAPAADQGREGDAAGTSGRSADSTPRGATGGTTTPTLSKRTDPTPSGEPTSPASTPTGAVPPPPATPPSAAPTADSATTQLPQATPPSDATTTQPSQGTPPTSDATTTPPPATPSSATTPPGGTPLPGGDGGPTTPGDSHATGTPTGTPSPGWPTGATPAGPWAVPPAPRPRRRTGLVATVLAAVLVAGGVGGGVGYLAGDRDTSSTVVSADPGTLDRAPDSVAGIAKRALPSVVTIQAEGTTSSGTGTGFVFDKEGHILTNNHVVAGAADGGHLSVVFSNGKKYDAEVVGRAEGYDIAVLRLTNADDVKLEPLPLGESDKVAVGDTTIAIGAPYGLSGTVTTGIISAKNRPVAAGGDERGGSASYLNALQTDASINPGNSGGPLLDANGAVIGVNSAIKPAEDRLGQSQGGSIGLGFAIPINQAKRVAQTLIKTGVPVYAVIGVRVHLGENGDGGARIVGDDQSGEPAVTPGGPADRAGLKPGDVITRIDDTMIDSGPTLIGTVWTYEPGDRVKVTYERDGKEKTVEVTLGKREGD